MSEVTPLMHTIILGYDDLTFSLIEMGANINHQDINGFTPLHCAAQYGRLSVIEKLLAVGARIVRNNCDEKPNDIALPRKAKEIKQIFDKQK